MSHPGHRIKTKGTGLVPIHKPKRWCKYADNWFAFIQLASAHILMDMTVCG
jgi:membrane-bound metal-dependent hydrolase YbcI (DUF457 family)